MLQQLRRQHAVAASLAVLLALVFGFAGDFIHTDDGCRVETHCLACQRGLTSVSADVAAPAWHPGVVTLEPVVPTDVAPTLGTAAPAAAGRAPPLA